MLPQTSTSPLTPGPVLRDWPEKLTTAERPVAMLLGEGLTNKEIACALGKSVPTIRNHVASILDKTDTSSRGRFIALFHRTTLGPEFLAAMKPISPSRL